MTNPAGTALHKPLNRRHFLYGIGTGLFVLGTAPRSSLAQDVAPSVLSGREFDLQIGDMVVNLTGKRRVATVVNGQLPAPLLRWREGDTVTLRVANHSGVRSSIHWHGLILPADMDGVPGLSFEGIPPGGSFLYRFKVNQTGTYWYHAHSGFQEQTGLYGPIIIEPRDGPRYDVQRDYVVMLSDWSDVDPARIYARLKKQNDYFNFGKRTAADLIGEVREKGVKRAIDEQRMWGQMRMNPRDLADVSGYAYTYLLNGMSPAHNWSGLFQRGDRVRLRFINGSAMSIFDVRIPGLKLTVIAADGQDVEPVSVDELRIATAETYDVIVQPSVEQAYTIFAQSIDRSGFARGTLTPQAGMAAQVPAMDPRPELTMLDMGMAGMSGMDHGSMDHGAMQPGSMDHGAMQPGSMDHGPVQGQGATQGQPRLEDNPIVDMTVAEARTALDDPGIGLRNNGRRVLTYADLHTLGGSIDQRAPGREIELHLTGHMERFIWSFNGQKFSEAQPLRFNYGERLRITLVNDSMMTHPIHLHGMWSEIETPQGEFLVRKHTVSVQPAQKISYAVTADALGRWAYHCHLLYHMEAGMFREVHVERAQGEHQ